MPRAKNSGNGTTTRNQVATMPSPKPVEVRKTAPSVNLEEQIRVRAYQLYEERGYTPGHQERRLAGRGAGNSHPLGQSTKRVVRTRQR